MLALFVEARISQRCSVYKKYKFSSGSKYSADHGPLPLALLHISAGHGCKETVNM